MTQLQQPEVSPRLYEKGRAVMTYRGKPTEVRVLSLSQRRSSACVKPIKGNVGALVVAFVALIVIG